MKKVLCFLLASLVFIGSVPAIADNTLDLSSMTIDELVSLRDSVNAELSSRNFAEKEVIVPPGKYEIGVDIPAGVYTVGLAGDTVSMLTTYTSKGNMDKAYSLTSEDNIGKLTLQNGQSISIDIQSVMFAPYRGLGF